MSRSIPSKETSSFPTLSNRVAIVTGASRGIGHGIALELARRGARVAITYTSPSSTAAVEDLITQISALGNGSAAIGIRADLRDPSSPTKIVEETTKAFGNTIHILVNNAGCEVVKPLEQLEIEDYNTVFDLNVRAVILLSQAVLPHLPNGGRIVNIGSVGARAGFASLSLYGSSKAAMEGLTRCWARELGHRAITVNQVNSGPVQSEMLNNIPKELVDLQKKTTPVENRLGTVDDISQVVAWLSSEESRWISGQVLSASGGWAMY
ncbi:NAD(P)-binding protein [Ascobolus immersus RN42]|uniref:NAD(P)-binding protein n=1 Tax=Ascobolus immersus RN42 TaxID=1160509 RepID=A0A3N4HXK5_ASCIM|nr:NAD(P)-binding protein [Ascobolus immersus RN42]